MTWEREKKTMAEGDRDRDETEEESRRSKEVEMFGVECHLRVMSHDSDYDMTIMI